MVFDLSKLQGRNSTGTRAIATSGPCKGQGKGMAVDHLLSIMLLSMLEGKPATMTATQFDAKLKAWFPEGTTFQSPKDYIGYYRSCTNNQGPTAKSKAKDGKVTVKARDHVCKVFDAFVKANSIPMDAAKPKGPKCKTGADLFLNHTQWTFSFKEAK